MSGAQPIQLALPFWAGKLRKNVAISAAGDAADESGDDAILAAISKQTKVVTEEQAPAAPAQAETTQPKGPRKMNPANLGALGQINKPN